MTPCPLKLRLCWRWRVWLDLAQDLGPTTEPGLGRVGRRIDRAYANAQVAALVRRVSLRWDLGISLHAAIEIQVTPAGVPCARAAPFLGSAADRSVGPSCSSFGYG